MTATLPATGLPADSGARGRLPVPVRDRRPALAALALLLILAGALGSALVAYRSGSRVDVLVANRDIPIGTKVSASDFAVARVPADGGNTVAAGALQRFVGTYATTEVPQRTVLNSTMFTVVNPTPANGVVVGVVVSALQRPAGGVARGDVVRAYLVPRSSDGTLSGTAGQVLVRAARVVDVQAGANADSTAVSLLVSAETASNIVSAASSGQVSLARLPEGTEPVLDLVDAGAAP